MLCFILSIASMVAQTLKPVATEVVNTKAKGTTFTDVSSLIQLQENNGQLKGLKDAMEVSLFTYNKDHFQKSLTNQEIMAITMIVPLEKDYAVYVDLVEAPKSFYNYVTTTSSGGTHSKSKDSKHYRGIVRGLENSSLVAISFFQGEMMGTVSIEGRGNYNIGKLPNTNNHIIFKDSNTENEETFDCLTELNGNFNPELYEYYNTATSTQSSSDEEYCFELYVEVDHDTYEHFGNSVTDTENFIIAIFNEVSTLFANESINMTISEIFVWDTADSYTNNVSAGLNNFIAARPTYNGDLAHLVTFRSESSNPLQNAGGQASGFGGLCNDNDFDYAHTNLFPDFETFPTFSRQVKVLTHEIGHNLGSRHTHACVWNSNNTAIDGCAGSTEGSCSTPGNPAGGGTIMSYCDRTSVGIDFNLGFGPQPGNVIRNHLANADCLEGCIDCSTLVDFHFEHENEVEDTVFHICEDVYIDGAATDNTGTFFMDIWRVNGDGTVSWLSAQDPDSGLTSGWKYGSPDWVNVTETFVNDINHPVTFQAGVTYEVKIAISHPDCGWVSLTKRFTYTEGQMSSQFDIVDYNCHDGVFDVTVTAQDPAPNQWWRVYETDTQGATSDANTIGPVTGNQGGITTTFANLDPTKFYYIKHGVWTNNCPWQETRTPLTPDCCDEFNTADFSLGVDFDYNFWVGNYNGYEDLGATHEWYVLSSLNETGGPYTLVFSTTTSGGSNFPLFTNAQFGVYYTVVHKVVSYCGEICYVQVQYQEEGEALATENSAVAAEIDCSLIDEILNPECEAPTNLQFDCRTATMSWLGDPSLTYVVEVTWDDPSCRSCEGNRPRVMRWETQGTSFSLPYIDGSGCFSWRVGTKCEDEIEWSASECVDCYTRPQEPTDVRTEAKISPNPNDGNMNIEISGADKTNFTIKVYRFDGILIKSFDANRIENKLTTISWNGKSVLTPGIYFFVITTDTEIITKKVIIK